MSPGRWCPGVHRECPVPPEEPSVGHTPSVLERTILPCFPEGHSPALAGLLAYLGRCSCLGGEPLPWTGARVKSKGVLGPGEPHTEG